MNQAISFIRLISCDGVEQQHLCDERKHSLLETSSFRDTAAGEAPQLRRWRPPTNRNRLFPEPQTSINPLSIIYTAHPPRVAGGLEPIPADIGARGGVQPWMKQPFKINLKPIMAFYQSCIWPYSERRQKLCLNSGAASFGSCVRKPITSQRRD